MKSLQQENETLYFLNILSIQNKCAYIYIIFLFQYLYDLLMNYLEEKGVSNEFAEKLIELSTSYEHTAYVSLLEGLSKFTSKN